MGIQSGPGHRAFDLTQVYGSVNYAAADPYPYTGSRRLADGSPSFRVLRATTNFSLEDVMIDVDSDNIHSFLHPEDA